MMQLMPKSCSRLTNQPCYAVGWFCNHSYDFGIRSSPISSPVVNHDGTLWVPFQNVRYDLLHSAVAYHYKSVRSFFQFRTRIRPKFVHDFWRRQSHIIHNSSSTTDTLYVTKVKGVEIKTSLCSSLGGEHLLFSNQLALTEDILECSILWEWYACYAPPWLAPSEKHFRLPEASSLQNSKTDISSSYIFLSQ